MSKSEDEVTTAVRGDQSAKEWAATRASEFGAAVRFWRTKLELSAAELANRTREVGYPITRGTIAKIESNTRNAKVDFAEVVTLATALGVSAADLVFFGYPENRFKLTPRTEISSAEARHWFVGSDEYQQYSEIGKPRIDLSESVERSSRNYYEAVQAFESRRRLSEIRDQYFLLDSVLAKDPSVKFARERFEEEVSMIYELREKVIESGGYVTLPKWWGNYSFVPF